MLDSVCLQCRHILNLSCPDRVEMDVCDKLLEIGILLTENRFVAVLKKMPVSVMSPIELHRIACQKPTHDRCNRNSSSAIVAHHPTGTSLRCPSEFYIFRLRIGLQYRPDALDGVPFIGAPAAYLLQFMQRIKPVRLSHQIETHDQLAEPLKVMFSRTGRQVSLNQLA